MLRPAELVWLLAAVAKGDAAAFERLYAATSAKLHGVVLRILRRPDVAAEVLQEVYGAIWREAGTYDPAGLPPLRWMLARARQHALDRARRPDDGGGEQEAGGGAMPGASRREMNEELKRLLGCLGRLEPDRQRLVLLAYFDGFSREQLAARLGVSMSAIRNSLRQSLAEIRNGVRA